MDPQTLSPEAQALYQKVRKQYKVAFEPLKVQGHLLNLLKVTDLEQVLAGKDPLKDASSFPFWINIWEASLVLADLLASLPDRKDKTLLELGAGLGVPGLTAAAAGFQVTLSDYEELILDFERINAAASNLSELSFSLLDWKNPPAMQQFDILAGAEILFREEFFEPLLQVMAKSIKPDGVIYLAHDIRRKSLQPFLHLAERDYHIAATQRRLQSHEDEKTIVLTRLKPRR